VFPVTVFDEIQGDRCGIDVRSVPNHRFIQKLCCLIDFFMVGVSLGLFVNSRSQNNKTNRNHSHFCNPPWPKHRILLVPLLWSDISHSAMPSDQENNATPMSDCKCLVAHTEETLQAGAAVWKVVDWLPCFGEPSHRRGFDPTTQMWFGCNDCTSFIKKHNRGKSESYRRDRLTLPSNWRCFGCQQKDMYWRHPEVPSALQSLCDNCDEVWQCIGQARKVLSKAYSKHGRGNQ
jgi:hypothetical protein